MEGADRSTVPQAFQARHILVFEQRRLLFPRASWKLHGGDHVERRSSLKARRLDEQTPRPLARHLHQRSPRKI